MQSIFIGGGGKEQVQAQCLLLEYANRHGLIAGATGTGKTVTLQIMAESFSNAGVPVFLSDVKGDLSGMCLPGRADFKLHEAFQKRASQIAFDGYSYGACPVCFWDAFGDEGLGLRSSIAQVGPLMMARMLDLTEAQEGILNIVFRVADEEGLLLVDLKDLQAVLRVVGEKRGELSLRYGNVSVQSIGAIQRKLLTLESQGAVSFFAAPELQIEDLMRISAEGRGVVNILSAHKLAQRPQFYATVMLWLLSELFETLPEVGDLDKPKLVFFFDEAHLLFDDAPKALIDRIEMVARLIRSKGVGVYFVTQSPDDIPPDVLGQLGNRIQHALRAFTARDRRAIRLAAETYHDNPRFNTAEVIQDLGVGEALTSFLDEDGAPGMVERTLIRPPSSQLGPATATQMDQAMRSEGLYSKYAEEIDPHSAFETLKDRADKAAREAQAYEEEAERAGSVMEREYKTARRFSGARVGRSSSRSRGASESISSAFSKALVKELKGTTGRRIVRGLLGSLFSGR